MTTTIKALICAGLCGILLVAGAREAGSQSYQGGLRGAVRDVNGVIPGAEVELINEDTNAKRATATNDVGEYAFTNVLPGNYTLSAAMPGYKKFESKGIRIGAQTFITLDVTLEIGQIAEAITVTGQSPVIETSNASVASTLDKTTLETLPTAGRNAFFLAVTTPNVVPSGDPIFVRQQDQTNSSLLSLGGGPRRGNNYTLEGVPITDMRNRAVIIPNIESVDEVKVQVSTYDAEMGRTGGGVFNTVGKSGSNNWHGSALYQNRPAAAQSKLFFARSLPKPDTYFHLYGGSFGGPIVHDKTFFWASTEGYKTKTVRNTVLTLPTERERNGDFSQSGITIFDPTSTTCDAAGNCTRTQFQNNVIPPDKINQVAKNMLQFLPLPTAGRNRPATAELVDRANQLTLKIDQRWNDKWTTTGMYGYYDSREPETRFFGKDINQNPADPGDGLLLRTVNLITLNNIWVPSSTTVMAFRYGYNQFVDDCVPTSFDPGTLGFSQGYLNVIPVKKFPRINVQGYKGYRTADDRLLGDRDALDITWYSHNANASWSKFVGRHTVKAGGDYRQIGLKLTAFGQGAGSFSFTKAFTQGPSPNNAAAGDAFASFLLGFPSSGSIPNATPSDFFINYYAGYAQDDFRITPNLTVNFGLRYEYETGLAERDDAIAVGFCRDCPYPDQVPGLNLKGGLMYAGVDGNHSHQGDPSKKKFGPRGGFAYSIDTNTVLRGGYGLFWAPTQYPFPSEDAFGQRGFTAVTSYQSSFDGGLTPCPGCSLSNPFPNGIEQPRGSADGLRTGVGGEVNFVDQFGKSAYVQQYSIDLQRELPGYIAVSIGYLGSRAQNLGIGGTVDALVNINQIPTEFQSLQSALQQTVPNPFFGNPAFGNLSRSSTINRGQLLRPYPQFTDLFAHRVTAARTRYNSLVAKGERRIQGGWGARINYTFSRLKDNQFGEGNTFSSRRSRALDNYDLDREYGLSLLDAPHRLNLTATFELPFGEGKRWLNRKGVLNALLGGWAVTGVGSYQSGFPIQVSQASRNSNLLGSDQRPNIVSGQDPGIGGSPEDNFDPSCGCVRWLNPNAWSPAAAFTFGNAPRTDGRFRTPMKKNWDIAFQKSQSVGGKMLMLRAELINALNNPNWLGPETSFGTSNFGQITEVGGFPRLLQLLVRVGW